MFSKYQDFTQRWQFSFWHTPYLRTHYTIVHRIGAQPNDSEIINNINTYLNPTFEE